MLQGFSLPLLEHSHGDNDWHPMVERQPHDASGLDPERSWSKGRIFRCATCSDEIRVSMPEDRQSSSR